MRRAAATLLLLAACGGRGAEEEGRLREAIAAARTEIAALERQAARLPGLRQQVEGVRAHLARAGQFDGPDVPAILPEARVRSILESDVRGTGAGIAVSIRGPLKGRFRWDAKVTPEGKVWQVAEAIAGDRSTEPTRLLDLVDRSGLLQGHYPLIPSEDLDEKPLPPVAPKLSPVASPATEEGRRLAAELAGLERRRVALVTDAAEAQRTEANLQKLVGRQSVVDQVGHEMVRQRILLGVAVQLDARKLRFREGSAAAEVHLADRDAALRAVQAPALAAAGLTATPSGERLEVSFTDPPELPDFEARRVAFVKQP